MKWIGFSLLFFAFSTALAAPTHYQVETIIKKNGKPEKMSLIIEPNKPATISSMDLKTRTETQIEVTLEPMDSDTVFLNYKIKELAKGKETVIAEPQMMVFLGQNATMETGKSSKDSVDLSVKVIEQQSF